MVTFFIAWNKPYLLGGLVYGRHRLHSFFSQNDNSFLNYDKKCIDFLRIWEFSYVKHLITRHSQTDRENSAVVRFVLERKILLKGLLTMRKPGSPLAWLLTSKQNGDVSSNLSIMCLFAECESGISAEPLLGQAPFQIVHCWIFN